jgi:diaminopimelate epimerase
MRITFTKMHGAGNDFVVLDETQQRLHLTPGQYRWLADRHVGVGADQILSVRPAPSAALDFEYVIHNADGGEVEQCGNGARCFAKFVRDRGLTRKDTLRVQTKCGVIEPRMQADGRVTVNMGVPVFDVASLPFNATGLQATVQGHMQLWPLDLKENTALAGIESVRAAINLVACVSMGNPHAVQLVHDVDAALVLTHGPLVESHPRFAARVNAGFMQVVSRTQVRLRVYERGAGETLACGSGACAAVAAGVQMGLLDACVDVDTRGGRLGIEWAGEGANVLMTGPATTVFEAEINIPDNL